MINVLDYLPNLGMLRESPLKFDNAELVTEPEFEARCSIL